MNFSKLDFYIITVNLFAFILFIFITRLKPHRKCDEIDCKQIERKYFGLLKKVPKREGKVILEEALLYKVCNDLDYKETAYKNFYHHIFLFVFLVKP